MSVWKREFPQAAPVLFDTGNFTDVPTTEGEIKTRALAEGMGRLGYRAVGVGERDLDRGVDFVHELAQLGGFAVTSGNIVYQKTGKPVFDPFVIVPLSSKEYKGLPSRNVRVGVVSFLRFNPTFLKPGPNGDNVIIANPVEEARKIIPPLRSKCDLLVVLGSLPKDDAHLIARMVPGIDVIFSAYGGILTGTEEKEGSARIIYLGNQGKYLAEVRAAKAGGKWETTQHTHTLGATYPDEPKMKEAVAAAVARVNEVARKAAEERARKLAEERARAARPPEPPVVPEPAQPAPEPAPADPPEPPSPAPVPPARSGR